MNQYVIKINGEWYCGEGEEHSTQIPQRTDTSGLRLSKHRYDAYVIVSVRNLKSHLDKILTCVKPKKLQIIDVIEFGQMDYKTAKNIYRF